MVTPAQQIRTRGRISAKHGLFFVLGLMTLFVLYHNEGFLLDHTSNTWKFFYPVRWKLLVHGAGGSVALILGALQFSTRLRQRFPLLHRSLGRTYLGGVLVAAPMAVYLSFTHGIKTMWIETLVQASAWLLTTLMAVLAARNRNFDVHQQWVMRSYAVTLIFVVDRVILDIRWLVPTTDAGAERLAWSLVMCALLVPQLIINRRELFARSSPR